MRFSPNAMKWLAAPVALLGFAAMPAPAQAPELAMLDKVQLGMWTLKERGRAEEMDRICVRNAQDLLQIQHRGKTCNRFVIEDKPGQVTVSYSCPGQGNGRTTIKLENRQLLQINSQGIDKNSPFAFAVEGRYAGQCS